MSEDVIQSVRVTKIGALNNMNIKEVEGEILVNPDPAIEQILAREAKKFAYSLTVHLINKEINKNLT